MSKNCDGKNAEHTEILVPRGTVFRDPRTRQLIYEVNKEGDVSRKCSIFQKIRLFGRFSSEPEAVVEAGAIIFT